MGFSRISRDILLPTLRRHILSLDLLTLCSFKDVFLEQLKAFGRFMASQRAPLLHLPCRGLDPQHVTAEPGQ